MHRRENGRGQNVSRQLEDAKEAAHAVVAEADGGRAIPQRPEDAEMPSARRRRGGGRGLSDSAAAKEYKPPETGERGQAKPPPASATAA